MSSKEKTRNKLMESMRMTKDPANKTEEADKNKVASKPEAAKPEKKPAAKKPEAKKAPAKSKVTPFPSKRVWPD